MSEAIKKIAINTGGGDAPGLNAVIHGAVHAARGLGWEIVGIREGYDGLLEPERFPGGGLIELHRSTVREISHLGGTILGTTNRGNPFHRVVERPDGSKVEVDCSNDLIQRFRDQGIDALIAVGGDGSLTIANELHKKGLCVVGVPKTIDNDLESTTMTFGFYTAVSFATECIDRLHSTALSHRRIMVVEVMGRYAGWIALHAGLAGRADAILIPEIPYSIDILAAHLKHKQEEGKPYSIVVVAEGARPSGGDVTVKSRETGARGTPWRYCRNCCGAAPGADWQGKPQSGARPSSARRIPNGNGSQSRGHVWHGRSLRPIARNERCDGGFETAASRVSSRCTRLLQS